MIKASAIIGIVSAGLCSGSGAVRAAPLDAAKMVALYVEICAAPQTEWVQRATAVAKRDGWKRDAESKREFGVKLETMPPNTPSLFIADVYSKDGSQITVTRVAPEWSDAIIGNCQIATRDAPDTDLDAPLVAAVPGLPPKGNVAGVPAWVYVAEQSPDHVRLKALIARRQRLRQGFSTLIALLDWDASPSAIMRRSHQMFAP